jgi:periplasmic divalent cation tolerance protein
MVLDSFVINKYVTWCRILLLIFKSPQERDNSMKSLLLISTTFETQKDAKRIAELLLDRKLIACSQISAPMTSIYRWKGQIATEIEYTLTMKTTPALFDSVKDFLDNQHPYEVPEIIGRELTHINPDYLEWVYEEVK